MRMTDPEAVADFLVGGHAIFTLVSVKTGARYTYRVKTSDSPDLMFVHLKVAVNFDEEPWCYIGVIRDGERFDLTKASKLPLDAAPIRAISWFWTQIIHRVIPDTLEFWHEGQCAACAGRLTVPESIKRGYGPTCWAARNKRG